ncbi:MAG TPA: DUF512 domain-containing protein [Bacillota bacterium]|jgi:putative radical SAM enzyme (TIGR03279 family)|nr:DUF512 domain-containing protein [Bacillota bacterium]HPT66534.1 DUF512 domain-containing protein [Bacillota bacterium]
MGKCMAPKGAVIRRVARDSIGAELGLCPGDRIIKINGRAICDLIDYTMLQAGEDLQLVVERTDGECWEISVEKDEDEGLGLEFEEAVFDGIRPCANRCVFCFVDQMPKGQRPTLYIKDDDYRLSFLQGSYITLTNLRPADWQRIERLRLSPLYVSVHATDPAVRQRLLGQPRASRIMDDLRRLQKMGILLHTQAVLCPGINDGPVLEQTLQDLSALWPTVQSLAVVPVGLTAHREGLASLRRFTKDEARCVVEMVHRWQDRCRQSFGTHWVWPTDEFYLQAGLELPEATVYEDYLQLENGVGLWRLFHDEVFAAMAKNKGALAKACGFVGVVTGESAVGLWEEFRAALQTLAPGLKLTVYPVKNGFFGPDVTVTGLVVGSDILATLQQARPLQVQKLLLPSVMLRYGESVFLDGTSVADLSTALSLPIEVVPFDGEALIEALCVAKEERRE